MRRVVVEGDLSVRIGDRVVKECNGGVWDDSMNYSWEKLIQVEEVNWRFQRRSSPLYYNCILELGGSGKGVLGLIGEENMVTAEARKVIKTGKEERKKNIDVNRG